MKKHLFVLLVILLLIVFNDFTIQASPIQVKDYIVDKFPTTFVLYLSSLNDLDETEKEFIDLLEQMPKETQKLYAKKVYDHGFSKFLLEELKTITFEESTSRKYDFRELKWGMRPIEVKKTEESKLKFKEESSDEKMGHFILYFGEEAGINCYIRYIFENEKLAEAAFNTVVNHKNKNQHITDYNQWNKFLTEEYGKPISSIVKWKNEKYKDEPEKWGLAVLLKHLNYVTEWENSKTKIALFLQGIKSNNNNKQIMLIKHYASKEFMKSKEASFLGYWINEDANTPAITKIDIQKNNNILEIYMWGKCHPTDCDWAAGNNPEGPATTTVNDADDGVLNIVWYFDFAIETQEIRYLDGDRLEVYTFTDYPPDDIYGRKDSESYEYFMRSN